MVANLAVMLANKVPVDLNFTIGRAANESCCSEPTCGLQSLRRHSSNA
jgi:hypothetical protein